MDQTSARLTKQQQQLAQMLSRFCTLDPIASQPIETAFLAPLLREGDFLNVSGEAGCGKTMLAADLLLAFAHPERKGAALGGLFQFNPVYNCCGNVGIIDAETDPPRWQSLLNRKMKAESLDPNRLRGTIEYARPAELGLHQASAWSSTSPIVAAALAERGIKFVVIDSLGRTWSPDDLNSTAWVQQGFTPFRSACLALGITVVALTHTRRWQGPKDHEVVGPLGTSLQEAQADAQVMMTINSDGRGCRLKLRKSRRAYWLRPGSAIDLDFTPQLTYQPQDGWQKVWPHERPDESDDLEHELGMDARIHELLRGAPDSTLSATALAAALGCTPHTVTNHLTSLERVSAVVRQGNGCATRWRLRS